MLMSLFPQGILIQELKILLKSKSDTEISSLIEKSLLQELTSEDVDAEPKLKLIGFIGIYSYQEL